jgi:hypothetical protein
MEGCADSEIAWKIVPCFISPLYQRGLGAEELIVLAIRNSRLEIIHPRHMGNTF